MKGHPMKIPRTKEQIKREIAALKALKPIGRFEEKTRDSIELQIEELEFPFDETAEEWNELTDEQRLCVMDTRDWKYGYNDHAPSKEWAGLVT